MGGEDTPPQALDAIFDELDHDKNGTIDFDEFVTGIWSHVHRRSHESEGSRAVGKKTQTSITISFAALEGAACMNNTFCLAIFMGLVYFKGIAWRYTAETLSIVFVQLAVAVFARKGTLTPVDGALILAIYPLSVVLVAGLEAMGFD